MSDADPRHPRNVEERLKPWRGEPITPELRADALLVVADPVNYQRWARERAAAIVGECPTCFARRAA